MNRGPFDAAVVGGGILGCTTALHLARGGMRVVLLDKGPLCRQASGVNAGTLSLQYVTPAAIPYARKGRELWLDAQSWLGMDMGAKAKGCLTLAFTEEEAHLLAERTALRRDAGSPIEMVGVNRARQLEPELTARVKAAAHCTEDGLANASLTGRAYRVALPRAGADVREDSAVEAVARDSDGFSLSTGLGEVAARRVVLAAGAWSARLAATMGVRLDLGLNVNQVNVTERLPPLIRNTLGVVWQRLTLKQAPNGSVLIGGGWQGVADLDSDDSRIIPHNAINNVRLARHAVPALKGARIVRTWLGLQDRPPDHQPLAGPLPGVPGAFIISCAASGFTMGPYLGRLMADSLLGREPEMPLFDVAHAVVADDRRT